MNGYWGAVPTCSACAGVNPPTPETVSIAAAAMARARLAYCFIFILPFSFSKVFIEDTSPIDNRRMYYSKLWAFFQAISFVNPPKHSQNVLCRMTCFRLY